MIKIFDTNDTVFNTNGNKTIEPIKCIEIRKKSLNDWYIDVEVPIEFIEYIAKDKICLVKVKSKVNPQAFRITKDIEKSRNSIKFKANHVLFDAHHYFVNSYNADNLNALTTLNGLLSNTDTSSNFSVTSDVFGTVLYEFNLLSLYECFGVIEELLGGVFDADNFDISYRNSIGLDRGETLIYGKNLNNIKVFEDWESVVTRIYPVGKDGIRLPELYLDSVVQYNLKYVKKIEFDADNVDDLRTVSTEYLLTSQYPKASYELNVNINQTLELGDTIHVKHPLVNLLTEVQEYEFNVNTQKVVKLVFGNFVRDLNNPLAAIKNSVKEVFKKTSFQEQMIIDQTNTINNLNKNGYVYINANEILIGDTLPVPSAANIWRWGLGGLGFSPNGIEGPFTTAITYDGKFNADFITVGSLKGIVMEIGSEDNIFKADGNGIYLGNALFASAPFRVAMDGTGKIGGFNFDGTKLYATGTLGKYVGMAPGIGTEQWAFWAGATTPGLTVPFGVTMAGKLYARTIESGHWNIYENYIGGTVGTIEGDYIKLVDSTSLIAIYLNKGNNKGFIWNTGRITCNIDFAPSNSNTYNLGDSGTRWKYIYLNYAPDVSSDIRLKENVNVIDDQFNDVILNTEIISYNLIGQEEVALGINANRFHDQFKEKALYTVSIDENGYYGVKYESFIPMLIKTIQSQNNRIESLERRI